MNLIERIKRHEGFKNMPYKDKYGYPTIGYGTKLPITRDEAELLLQHRLSKKQAELAIKKPFITDLPIEAQEILLEMAYQLGVGGLLGFKEMWKALENRDFEKAADEMLDSRWARQTPNRAKELAEIMRSLG